MRSAVHERELVRLSDQNCMFFALLMHQSNQVPNQHPALTGVAVVNVRLTAGAFEPWLAEAAVAPVCVLTHSTVLTGALHTFIDVNLTGLS